MITLKMPRYNIIKSILVAINMITLKMPRYNIITSILVAIRPIHFLVSQQLYYSVNTDYNVTAYNCHNNY